MRSLKGDQISRAQKKEFESLRRGRRSARPRPLLFIASILLPLLLLAVSFQFLRVDEIALDNARVALESSGQGRAIRMVSDFERYREWIVRRGTARELSMFEGVAQFVFTGGNSLLPEEGSAQGMGFFQRIGFSFYSAVLRISFVLLACWRIWAIAVLLAALYGIYSLRVHEEDDLLGVTGNGRLFYTGIRASLDNVNEEGAPELHVVGLACPNRLSEIEVKTTPLGALLQRYNVDNQTNLALAGVIGHHTDWPAFVAPGDETQLLEDSVEPCSLVDYSTEVLERALSLHADIRREDPASSQISFRPDPVGAGGLTQQHQEDGRRLNLSSFGDALQYSLNRVLTSPMREELAKIEPNEIATVVLSLLAGRTMSYGFQGGRWRVITSFPQLTSRAILHSIPAFGKEYRYRVRTKLRHAIIYASRLSVFGPVRFPLNLSPQSAALRQWSEVLMALPYELRAVSDDVELYGLVRYARSEWIERFAGKVVTLDDEAIGKVFSTQHLFYVPLSTVLGVMRTVLDPESTRRLKELVARVSQKQKLHTLSVSASEEDEVHAIPAYERIFSPLSVEEARSLAELHDYTENDLHDWSAYRVVLNSSGWLGRRVGQYTVPDSSIILSAIKVADGDPEENELGLIERKGMVAMRGTPLEDKWGHRWYQRFREASDVQMAETRATLDKLMKGLQPDDELEDDIIIEAAS